MPNTNDSLRTTDHDLNVATPGAGVAAEFAPDSPSADSDTATHLPGQSTVPEPVPASVSVLGYEIEGVLGRGGMGVVYKAQHLALKRTVALKMVLAGGHAGPRELAHFRVEAEAVARLQHPNIVQIHDVGEAAGHPYCALEFVEGGSLAGKLDGKPMPTREAAKLVETLARAMQLAHSRNVVHRDLKPANILLTADGTPKITDFGLARQLDSDSSETQAGAVMGTPSYMAPEQASGGAHDAGPAADVYALGAILYDCLAGRPPFKGKSVVETLDQVRTQEPVPPSRWQAGVPLDLDTICLKCLRKEPENRYASAAGLANELVRYLNGEAIQARSVGRIERAVKWVKRNPVVAGAALAVVLALVVGTTVSYVKYRETEVALGKADEARKVAQERERAERWERYRTSISAAASALQLNNTGAARSALEAAPLEHRGWEWLHFANQLDDARFVLHGHESKVYHVAFSPDGRRIASAGQDKTVRLWDAASGKEQFVLRNERGIDAMAFSDDGKRIGSGSKRGAAFWDTATGHETFVLDGKKPDIAAAPFSATGTHYPEGAHPEKSIRLLDLTTGKLVARCVEDSTIHDVAISLDGRWIAVAAGHTVGLWDAPSGTRVATLRGHESGIYRLSFSPDGQRLVSGSDYPENALRLWKVATGEPLAVLAGHSNAIQSATFSPDGTRIASASLDQTVRLWEGTTGKPIAALRGHSGGIFDVAFSPDGKRLISASQDRTLRLWDVATGDVLAVLRGHTGEVRRVAFSPDGTLLASASNDRTIRLWDVELVTRRGVLRGHSSFVYDVAFSPDGTRVASAGWDGTVRLWDAATGRQTGLLRNEEPIISAVAFSPRGDQIAFLARDNAVHCWDLATGLQVRKLGVPSDNFQGSRVVQSAKGDLLAAGSHDGRVRVWDAATGEPVAELSGHGEAVRDVAFDPAGGRIASAGGDHTIRLWDVAKKESIQVLRGHTDVVYAVAFSGDGRLLASGSTDGTARLWDAATFAPLAVLSHGSNVYKVAFSPDGTRLATACADNTIRLWDLKTRQQVAELRGHTDYVHAVAWSPDGTRLVSGSGDFTVRIWDSLSAQERAQRTAKK